MTLWGFDVSHNQAGLKVADAKAQGYDFMVAKCTEGQHTSDESYADFVAQAKASQMLFAAYHFLHSDSTPAAQAANLAAHIGDKSIPVWIDLEPERPSEPTLAQAVAFRDECKTLGITVVGVYFPHFWWSEQGQPSLKGWVLWQALYGTNPTGHAAAIYPGDNSIRWNAQGGVVPTLLQFDSRGQIDGYAGNVDVDAFRGTRDELAALSLFKDYKPAVSVPGLRVVTANIDFQLGHDAEYIAHLCETADVVLVQEAKNVDLSKVVPAGFTALQDMTNAATMGSAIIVRDSRVKPLKLALHLGTHPFLNKIHVRMLTRWIATVHAKDKLTGDWYYLVSAHLPPARYKFLQPGMTKRLRRVLRGASADSNAHPYVIFGTDANEPLVNLAKELGLRAVPFGIVGLVYGTGIEVVSRFVDRFGKNHKFTDHPAIRAVIRHKKD